MSDTIRVLFDAGIFASQGVPHASAKSGIHRVTERLARGLAEAPECELRFAVSGSAVNVLHARRYLADSSALQGVPLHHPAWYVALVRKLSGLSAVDDGSRDASIADEVDRKLSLRVLTRLRRPTGRKELESADIFHSPYFALPTYARTRKLRRFIAVQDLIPVLRPEWFPGIGQHYFADILESIQPADWVITPSEATKADLCDYRHDLSPEQVVVVPWAADGQTFHAVEDESRLEAVRRKYGIPEGPFVLALANPSGNTLEIRKNVARLLGAFELVARQTKVNEITLVIAGKDAWRSDPIFARFHHDPDLQRRVVVTGYIADEDLASVYSGAMAFIYPSLYEGFGLPPLEAMQCGVPVIASNTTSIPEVVGDAGLLVDPTDEDAIADAMLKLLGDATLRRALRAKSLERAEHFSWERCAAQTMDAYKAAIDS